jgi:processive 1,2-diacylglycerol beta-glucosyltransferase
MNAARKEIKKVAILSVSAGAGHVRAAEALVASAKLQHPGIEAIHVDVMDLVPKIFRKIYAESYVDVVNRHPALWGYLYHTADKARNDSTLTRVRRGIEKLNTRGLVKHLEQLDPDVVICTHFLPAQILSRLIAKKGWSKPVWVVVTDFDVHALWVHPHMTGYCAASEEIAWRMRERGLADTRIEVTGIPIMPIFSEARSRAVCAKEAGIDPKRTTLLVMSGGLGPPSSRTSRTKCSSAGKINVHRRRTSRSLISPGLHPHHRTLDGLRRCSAHQTRRTDVVRVPRRRSADAGGVTYSWARRA